MRRASVIRKQLVIQLSLVAVASIGFFTLDGVMPAGSVLFGGGIAVVNLLLLEWRRRVADSGPALSATASLRVLYRTALERFVAVVALFAVALGVLRLDPLALIGGFIIGQLALLMTGTEKTD